jgi:predicted acylesterase/phospholipase RssA/CRP-like cAMP-binding protein
VSTSEPEIRAHLKATPPFSQFPEALVEAFVPNAEWVSLAKGERLFGAGDDAGFLYLVAEGRLQEVVPAEPDILIAELGPHALAGEVQLLTGGKRTTKVTALEASRLLRLPKVSVDWLTFEGAMTAGIVNEIVLHRLRRDRLAVILAEIFGRLDAHQLQDVMAAGDWVTLRQGDELMRQGEPSQGFCVLVGGLLGVSVRGPDGALTLVSRVRSGIIGEISILTGDPHTATVFAIRESELVRFPKERFFELGLKYPAFLLQIARLNVQRLRRAMGESRDAPDTAVVSLIPACSETPIAEFARRLAAELSSYCPVLHLDAAGIDTLLEAPGTAEAPPESPLQARFPAWLAAQEGTHRFILLQADALDSNWTRACIRHSDQIIAVGLAAKDPAPAAVEAALYDQRTAAPIPKRLVLIHPDASDRRPRGTRLWLERRGVDMHHHVRLGSREDLRRLARFLTGSATCLALGGGGARGFAHIGALRAFSEAGVSIDMIAGTSMGAVMGAEYAMGIPPEDMVEMNRDMFQKLGLLFDATLPLLSFTTGKAYVQKLKQVFGDVENEDLWIPFFCVSSNISRARKVLHRTGTLWRNLRASSGVQGLFPPVVIDGDLHVDGALFSNLPADVVRSVCEGRVIAVDVTPPVDLSENSDYGDTVSGWRILWRRLFPGRDGFRVTGIATVMQRAAEAVSMANQKQAIEKMSDFYLRMPVDHINLLDFGAIDRLAEIGYQSARARIPEWRSSPRWVEP